MVRAIRGATTADRNEKELILEATAEMLLHIISENALNHDDIIDIIFTVTPDLNSVFPAVAARRIGFTDVPLLDMAAPEIDGALKMCIRALVHINTDKDNKSLNHVYLRGAKVLRPDLLRKEK